MLKSIRAFVFVRSREVVRFWEGPLREAPLYSLGMVKMEAFDDSHFMHQAVRVGHTDHTGSIVFPMACIYDLKKKFLCNRKLIKIVLCLWSIALVW